MNNRPFDARIHAALETYLDVSRDWHQWESWQIEAMRRALATAAAIGWDQ